MAQPTKGGVPPKFTATLKGTIVKAGQMARFDAKLNNDVTKPLEVHWTKNGQRIIPTLRVKLVEENNVHSLLITEPGLGDSGTYECVVKNKFGHAQCQAQLLIESADKTTRSTQEAQQARPKIVEPMKALMIKKGQPAVFSCKISGKEPVYVKWMKGDKTIESSKRFEISREADVNTLRISDVSPQDEGEYKCAVSNEAGSAEVRAPLKVL